MLRSSRTFWFLAVVPALAAVLSATAFAEERDDAVRAKVEAFQESLKAAWEVDDRDHVLAHFQHGDLLPPSSGEYRMLGRLRFWDRPLKQATRERDGTIHAEFVMDPESDLPAHTMTFVLIEGPDGRLLVKSEATPEQLAQRRRLRQGIEAAPAETARLETELEARPALESELFPHFKDWFWRFVDEQAKQAGMPLPEGIRESLLLRPLGEIHRGDRAVLFVFVGAKDKGPNVEGAGFERRAGSWELVEDRSVTSPEAVERFLGDPGERQIVRRAALQLEMVPAFYSYVRGTARQRYRVALEARDVEAGADLLEMALSGLPLDQAGDVLRKLTYDPEPLDFVRLGRSKVDGDQAIVSLEVVSDGRMELETLELGREGEGWVIAGPFTTPSEQTKETLNRIAGSVEFFKQERGALPKAEDLEALQVELASVEIPGFSLQIPGEDGWGTTVRYAVSEDRTRYRILSAGADKTFNHEDWAPTPRSIREKESLDPNEDIIFENGRFVRWHKKGIW